MSQNLEILICGLIVMTILLIMVAILISVAWLVIKWEEGNTKKDFLNVEIQVMKQNMEYKTQKELERKYKIIEDKKNEKREETEK